MNKIRDFILLISISYLEVKVIWKRWKATVKEIAMLIALQLAVGYMILEVMGR